MKYNDIAEKYSIPLIMDNKKKNILGPINGGKGLNKFTQDAILKEAGLK
ncbi:hypothetical protein [Lactobacillus sp. ESL0233]|nr:hypothetical protein [Lactobacillus sp. ESL0233]